MTTPTRRERREQERERRSRSTGPSTNKRVQQRRFGPWAALGAVLAVALLIAGGRAFGAFGPAPTPSEVPSPTTFIADLPPGTQVFSETDRAHTDGPVTYDHVPPAGGAHNAVWLDCGVYDRPVPDQNAVHSLEHGTVWVTYQPDLASAQVATLRQIVTSHYVGDQRYLILSPYPGLPAPIVATAWGAQLQLQDAGDPRLAAFIQRFAGGAQGGEPGAACTGGTGTPIG